MHHKAGYFSFSCKVAHLAPGAACLSFLGIYTKRAWEKLSNAQDTCSLTQVSCEAQESMAVASAAWEVLCLPFPFWVLPWFFLAL